MNGTMILEPNPRQHPLIAELMMLFVESHAAWYFGTIVVDSQSQPLRHAGYQLIESGCTTANSTTSDSNNRNQDEPQPSANVNNPPGEDGELNEHSPLIGEGRSRNQAQTNHINQWHKWSTCDYAMALGSGILSAVLFLVGVYYPSIIGISTISFAVFRIMFWSTLTALVLIGYLAIRHAKVMQWIDFTATSFEYFIIVCHVCITLFSTFQIVATLSPEPKKPDNNADSKGNNLTCDNPELQVVEEVFNIIQFCSQVIRTTKIKIKITFF